MYSITVVLIVLLVITTLCTVFLILIQDDQGGGLGLLGSSGQNPFSTGDSFLNRLTKIFVCIFAGLCLSVAFLISRFGANYDALLEAQSRLEQNEDRRSDWFLDYPVEEAGSLEDNQESLEQK